MAQRCEVCKIDLTDDYSYQGHLTGKKHKKNLKFAQHKQNIQERSIFVFDFPSYLTTRELVDFFLQYGSIQSHRFQRGYALIEFEDSAPVDFLTSHPVFIRNHRLRIKRKIFHDNLKPANTEDQNKLSYEEFKEIFEGETTFDSQLIAFLNAIQHGGVIEGGYGFVCSSLYDMFRTRFHGCEVHKYGSTVTGLSFKKSDLDVYVNIGLPIHENEENAHPCDWTPKKVFRMAKSLLFKRKNTFTDIVLIPNAKTPIIKCRHAPTNILCDISFKNSLGVRNSDLIKFYLSLDTRLKPLVIILKFWGQLFGIAGTGKISNYALTMLIIFFLQQPERAIIPTVAELQSTVEPEFVQGWQVNYNKNFKNQPIDTTTTIPDLLYGFFDFYARFDFNSQSQVVCPLDGKAHPKTYFTKVEELPMSMLRYKEYVRVTSNPVLLSTDKPMCIQDPIELNHNVTSGICSRAVDWFQQQCITSREVCEKARESDNKTLFSMLFTNQTIVEKKQKMKMSMRLLIRSEKFLKTVLPPDSVLQPDIINRGQFTIANWFEAVLRITKDTFERVLKLDVKLGTLDREAKQQKCEIETDVHSNDNTRIILECSGFYKLWYGRGKKKPVFDPTLSILDKEAGISDLMVQELEILPAPSIPIINFICIFEKQLKPVSVLLEFKNNKSVRNTFGEFSTFIASKLPQIVDKTLLHMLQFEKVDSNRTKHSHETSFTTCNQKELESRQQD